MDEILSKKHYREVFYVFVALLLVLALLLKFHTVPNLYSSSNYSAESLIVSLLDNLIATLIITIFVGGFIFWLKPEIAKRSAIEVVEPKQISALLKQAVLKTDFWTYKGACGRYTRAVTFPKMAEGARNEGMGRDISVYLLSPRNNAVCTEYATYRRSLKSGGTGTAWTCKSVQEEIIATSVAALKYRYTEPLLGIRLFFIDSFSAFRLDISAHYVIITKEEKEASALRADSGTYFYDSYRDDVRLTERQAQEVELDGYDNFDGDLTEDQLYSALDFMKLRILVHNEGLDISRILELINSPSNPY